MEGSDVEGPRQARAERMADASRDLEAQSGEDDVYTMSANLAAANVDGCDAASLSVVSRGKGQVQTRGASDERVRHGDFLQYDTGEGPCLDAVWSEVVVTSPSLSYDQRWPVWGPRVVSETGFNSILSLRLFSHADTIGALNLYAEERAGFDDEDVADGLALAAHIAVAVVASQASTNLQTALGSRTVIGQATGMLIERYGLTAEVAFSTLVRAAAAEGVKVRVLAAELVQTGHLRGIESST